MANEQPDYTVIKKDKEFEIRQYTNFLTANIETEGVAAFREKRPPRYED